MDHVTIRRIREADAESLRQLYEDPDVYTDTLQLPFPSHENWKKRLSEMPPTRYALVAEIAGEIVGNVALDVLTNLRRRHVGDIAISVKGVRQGQGIGNKLLSSAIEIADNWINLMRLELTVFVDNEPAIALYKKHGFVIEGEFVKYAFRNGQYVNAYHMARLKADVV
ncbi:GNAT family N-acetyltransferase [Trinickia dinghuensis]|uniref:GNAT family N-acetyltransferase n=1 Tax=Trinickia dinghuensis TaxID=2291023 RepID=A0A3D8K5F7_9BURK|nr:GNAT family N-acetyltransferase [Trinickia dinghuensis]RDV00549.1 GNAT family N-acetyltransferase [Trinickia dinghuensis]